MKGTCPREHSASMLPGLSFYTGRHWNGWCRESGIPKERRNFHSIDLSEIESLFSVTRNLSTRRSDAHIFFRLRVSETAAEDNRYWQQANDVRISEGKAAKTAIPSCPGQPWAFAGLLEKIPSCRLLFNGNGKNNHISQVRYSTFSEGKETGNITKPASYIR